MDVKAIWLVKAICSCFALALVIGPSESSCILDLVLDFLLYKGALIISFKYKDLLFFFYFLVRWGENTTKKIKESKLT
jgi:hypothetical protein